MATVTRIDEIYNEIDEMLWDKRFGQCDEVLRRMDLERLDVDEIISYLTATLSARSNLLFRQEFYHRAEKILRERREYKEGLLKGLE